ncbi:MAG: hypothetical protein AAF198_13565 [Pseudomonadota bacterium]
MTRTGLFSIFGALGLILLVLVAGWALLFACALNLRVLDFAASCPTHIRVFQSEIDDLTNEQKSLQARAAQLERELAALNCRRTKPNDPIPLTPDALQEGRLDALYGCWDLDQTYRTRDVDTGQIRTYNDWQVCFDTKGQGKQRMLADDGTVCAGPVTAAMSGDRLSILEAENLDCSDGGYIHQRDIECALDGADGASCSTFQPETQGEGETGFKRLLP